MGWFANDLQSCTRTLDGDPRTGTFPQMQVTAGDTACSVKGVLKVRFQYIQSTFKSTGYY